MLNFKFLIYILIVFNLASCKTSPSAEEGQESTILIPVASGVATANETASEPQAAVTSSADTNTSSIDASAYSVQSGDFNLYPRETNGWDESGWSIITPSDDTRLIYVSSSSGDDAIAEFYAPRDVLSVEEPGLIKPYKTIAAAMANAREGYADWILLLKGDVWYVNDRIHVKSGRSVSDRSVITSYGGSGERPIIKSDADEILRIWTDRSYIAVSGLVFYAYKRDPDSTEFSGWGNVTDSTAIRIYSPKDSIRGTILLEGNDFNYFSKGIAINGGGDVMDVVIRRNSIRNSYSERAHSQGIFASHVSALLEENFFDHNGWYKKQVDTGNENSEGQATIFNHNTYISNSFNSKFIRNIFLRSSSIHNKWTSDSEENSNVDSIKAHDLWMEDNVYVGGEIGISAGGNTDYGTGPRWKDITIINNVMLAIGRDQPTNRTLGWNIDATDWDGGLICGNYLLHTDNTLVNNLIGINLSGHSNNVTIAENTIHGLVTPSPSSKVGAISVNRDPKSNILVSGNTIQLVGSNMRVVVADQIDSVVFQGNKYFSSLDDDEWFRSEGVDYDINTWRALSGDVSSSVEQDLFLEPKRTFETYLMSIGLSESLDEFTEQAANQSKSNWNRDFTAQAVLHYIREAYGDMKCTQ